MHVCICSCRLSHQNSSSSLYPPWSSVCLWLPWIPARADLPAVLPSPPSQPSFPAILPSHPSQPGSAAAEGSLPSVLHISLPYPGSSVKLVKCQCSWDLSPSFKCGWNWQLCSKVIKGRMTDNLTRYLISLGNQAKKKGGGRGLSCKNHKFFQNKTFLCSLEHQWLAKAGGILNSNLNFSACVSGLLLNCQLSCSF